MTGGIYVIKFNLKLKFYIGSSSDIQRRFKEHRRKLRQGKHANQYLQKAWNKYGEEAFTFETIRPCENNLLVKYENYYLNKYIKIYNKGNIYNINPVSTSTLGYVRSSEHCLNISKSKKGKKLSQETKIKLSISHKGIKQSEEWVEKRIAAHRGMKRSLETRAKLKEAWERRRLNKNNK